MSIWDDFLRTSIGRDSVIRELQAWMKAFVLANDYPDKNFAPGKILLLHGPGACGKTTLIGVLTWIATKSLSLSPYELCDLRKWGQDLRDARLVHLRGVADLPFKSVSLSRSSRAVSMLEDVCAHNPVFYRPRNKDPLSFRPNCATVSDCNEISSRSLINKDHGLALMVLRIEMCELPRDVMRPGMLSDLVAVADEIRQWALDA